MCTITEYGFVIDNRKCIGCHACTVACKTEHGDPIGVNKSWVKYVEKGTFPETNRTFSVQRCNHCADAPCTDICPVMAVFEREDGIVDFDPERCVGCKACLQACPYDALYVDPETSTAAKCNYCSHRVDAGRKPACATVCPENAILTGDVAAPDSKISRTIARQDVQVRKPEKGTIPTLFYVDGDEGSVTPGATDRAEHYMWSDAPRRSTSDGRAPEEFDLQRAAESLAKSDVSAAGSETDRAKADGGAHGAAETAPENDSSRASRATDLLRTEARRVYDVAESHHTSWGWEVYAYTWTKSIAAGVFLLPAVLMLAGIVESDPATVGIAALTSLGFLALTTLLLTLDLERPMRFHWVLLRPNWRSWLTKGGYILSATGGVLALVTLAWLLGADDVVTHSVTLALGSVLVTASAVYTAFLLGQAKGRDLWQSTALPLHLFVQAVLAGGAMTVLFGVAGLGGFGSLTEIGGLALALALVAHATIVASELVGPHQTEDAEEAADRILSGQFRSVFWIGAVVAGIALPLVVLSFGGTPGRAAGAVLALLGLLAYEYCYLTAPQTISLT